MNRSVAADLGSGHVQLAQRKQAAGDAEAQLAGQVESLLRDWPAGDPVVDAHWDALGAMRCPPLLLPSRSNFLNCLGCGREAANSHCARRRT